MKNNEEQNGCIVAIAFLAMVLSCGVLIFEIVGLFNDLSDLALMMR